MKKSLIVLFASFFLLLAALDVSGGIVADSPDGALEIASAKSAAPVWVDGNDWWGVIRAAGDLQSDVQRVAGVRPGISNDAAAAPAKVAIIVGTLGKSALVDSLAKSGKIDGKLLKGRWESYLLQVVDKPFPGVDRALVIAGSDKRGTIYGIYTLSREMGVSPWYWWADVPARHRDAVYVKGTLYDDGPTVKYRGIFLNDEAPALTGWAKEKYGNLNSEFYGHVFELVLRLKGNYLWPAMWNNAFNEDDPKNPVLADAYGIVMGTSHHEPMVRSQQEWKRHGTGAWNYEKNGEVLRNFWADGIRRNKDLESIVTMGMRGDGDEAMSESTNTALLEKIVADQRAILEKETGKKASDVPQLWALYKEVQDYYEHGMRVPDDVTLLWCDDNWGNNRRLPLASERNRKGGAGIYYHFDYVGDPRSYKWLNTIPITKVWEQMNLAVQYDATRIWITNVGDLKPMEFPISFWFDYAWKPADLPYEKLHDYSVQWARDQFGADHAEEIAALVEGYTWLNSWRKPEMTASDTYSTLNYGEAERVAAAWKNLADRAKALEAKIPANQRDAYFQLVYYPVVASANVAEMYVAAGINHLYALQGRAAANSLADEVKARFDEDAKLAWRYNHGIASGKWNHMMDQRHTGWTYWQQPPLEVMPPVSYVHPLDFGAFGVAFEGSFATLPENDIFQGAGVLPAMNPLNASQTTVTVFNRGSKPVEWKASAEAPWLVITPASGRLAPAAQQIVTLSLDPKSFSQNAKSTVAIFEGVGPEGPAKARLRVPVENPLLNAPQGYWGYFVAQDCAAFDAAGYTRAVAGHGLEWKTLPGFGVYGSGVTAFPVVHDRIAPGADTPRLEYDVNFSSFGDFAVTLYVAPTMDFLSGDGINVAVSVDNAAPQILRVGTKVSTPAWREAVGDGFRKLVSKHNIMTPGVHTLKVWYVDPGVVVERIVIDMGGVRPSHFGPLPQTPTQQEKLK
jgi:hypothetical protein